MREILFRGKGNKKYNDGDWYYGVPIQCDDGDWQICTDCSKRTVVAETIEEYTGLTDKNGKKIFEGDILHFKAYQGGDFDCPIGTDIYYRVLFGHCNPDSDTLSEYVGFWALDKNYDEDDLYECGESINYLIDSHGAYVIGNIHDNPELLRSDTE